MSRPRPPYLHRTITRHGLVAWYVWRRPGPKIRIRGEYGSKEFLAAYHSALHGDLPQRRPASGSKTVAYLIDAYTVSRAWASLSTATQKGREPFLRRAIKMAGNEPFASIQTDTIKDGIGTFKPVQSKIFLDTMRGLFKWALNEGLIESDPTEGLKVKLPKTDGFHVWTDDEVRKFEDRWPIGSRERLWFAVLLYTGLRRSDALRIKSSELDRGEINLQTRKTATHVSLPVLRELQTVLKGSRVGATYVIESAIGRPFHPVSFSVLFGKACRAAGVKGSAHGLRKLAATRLAEAGASTMELNAAMGWEHGSRMSERYTRKADRKKLAIQAFERLKR